MYNSFAYFNEMRKTQNCKAIKKNMEKNKNACIKRHKCPRKLLFRCFEASNTRLRSNTETVRFREVTKRRELHFISVRGRKLLRSGVFPKYNNNELSFTSEFRLKSFDLSHEVIAREMCRVPLFFLKRLLFFLFFSSLSTSFLLSRAQFFC